jgi:hypothetical protein
MEPIRRWDIVHIFEKRYELLRVAPGLAEEFEWLKSVQAEALSLVANLRQPSKHMVQEFATKAMATAIGAISAWQAEKSSHTT